MIVIRANACTFITLILQCTYSAFLLDLILLISVFHSPLLFPLIQYQNTLHDVLCQRFTCSAKNSSTGASRSLLIESLKFHVSLWLLMSEIFVPWAAVAESGHPTHPDGGVVLNGSSSLATVFSLGSSASFVPMSTLATHLRSHRYPRCSLPPPRASCRSFAPTRPVCIVASTAIFVIYVDKCITEGFCIIMLSTELSRSRRLVIFIAIKLCWQMVYPVIIFVNILLICMSHY